MAAVRNTSFTSEELENILERFQATVKDDKSYNLEKFKKLRALISEFTSKVPDEPAQSLKAWLPQDLSQKSRFALRHMVLSKLMFDEQILNKGEEVKDEDKATEDQIKKDSMIARALSEKKAEKNSVKTIKLRILKKHFSKKESKDSSIANNHGQKTSVTPAKSLPHSPLLPIAAPNKKRPRDDEDTTPQLPPATRVKLNSSLIPTLSSTNSPTESNPSEILLGSGSNGATRTEILSSTPLSTTSVLSSLGIGSSASNSSTLAASFNTTASDLSAELTQKSGTVSQATPLVTSSVIPPSSLSTSSISSNPSASISSPNPSTSSLSAGLAQSSTISQAVSLPTPSAAMPPSSTPASNQNGSAFVFPPPQSVTDASLVSAAFALSMCPYMPYGLGYHLLIEALKPVYDLTTTIMHCGPIVNELGKAADAAMIVCAGTLVELRMRHHMEPPNDAMHTGYHSLIQQILRLASVNLSLQPTASFTSLRKY